MERRNPAAYKLRVYVGAIKDAKSMDDTQWSDAWTKHITINSTWISRTTWIAYLEACALQEAESMIESDDYREAA